VSRSINPKIIGAFVTTSIAVLVALVLFFGSAKIFSQSIHYIVFFENSVTGLEVGSLAKYKGVPVGIVEQILIRVEGQSRESTAIPVIVRIDRSRLTNRLGTSVEIFDPQFIHRMIESGLVAQLSLESYITGQLFVEFSMEPGQAKDFVEHRDGEYGMVEIPTLGSPFGEITDDVEGIISSFSEFDFYKTYQTINAVLEELLLVLQETNSEELSRSITDAVDQVAQLLKSGELEAILSSTHSALVQMEKTLSTYDLEKGRLAETIDRLDQTLTRFDGLIAEGNALIAPKSTLRYEMESSLRELRQVANSLRLFINYLERNPNALLTGRPDESQ